jgi:hypothetical protein
VFVSVQWDTLPRLKLLDRQGDGSANSGIVAKLRFLNALIVGWEHMDAFTNAATNQTYKTRADNNRRVLVVT